MQKVVFLLDALTHYRVPFFEHLFPLLRQQNIDGVLLCGSQNAKSYIEGRADWAEERELKKLGRFTWLEGSLAESSDADLVIISQVVRQLHLYPLLARQLIGRQKLALWGHGKVFGPGGNPLERIVKNWISKRVHWWFAYNHRSRLVVENEIGFPKERITTVMNSVDTTAMRKRLDEVTEQEKETLRTALGIRSNKVALHVSGMTSNKRIPFLLEAALLIRKQIPDFELIVIGPRAYDAWHVEEAAKQHSWIHYVGPKTALEAVPYWAISRVVLYPGMVGLVAVDSFAMGVPIITTDVPDHSVEIDYLKDGVNGIILSPWSDVAKYVQGVVSLLKSPETIDRLKAGALADAETYTIERMAENFAEGILAALSMPVRKFHY